MPVQVEEVAKVLERKGRTVSASSSPGLGYLDNLRREKRQPENAHKRQPEANDKVWDPNPKTERALDTLAIL